MPENISPESDVWEIDWRKVGLFIVSTVCYIGMVYSVTKANWTAAVFWLLYLWYFKWNEGNHGNH